MIPHLRRLRARSGLPRDVVVLAIMAFCVAVGFGVLIPVLPIFTRTFGVGNLAVGAVVSGFAVVRLSFSPLCGRLIDWMGERTAMIVGIVIVAASSSGAGFSQSYPQLLVLRSAGGVGSALFNVAAMSLLLGTTSAQLRGRASAVYQSGYLLGGMAGPALGGVMAAISLTAPFHFYAITLVVAGAVGILLLRTTRVHKTHAEGAAASIPLSQVWRDVRFRAACLSNAATGWNSFGVRSSLVPVLVVEVLHRNTTWTGITFAIAAVAQTATIGFAGSWVDRRGRKGAVIIASLVGCLCILAVAFVPTIWWLIVVLCLYGMAASFLGTAPAALVGDAAHGSSSRAVAVFSMSADVGTIIGPLAAGWLADHVSFEAAFISGASLLLVAGCYALRIPGPAWTSRRAASEASLPDAGA